MSVTIRLARHGTKKTPQYRIVVTESRSPRDGRFVERLGVFNPLAEPNVIEVAKDRLEFWLSRGAKPSATVAGLLKRAAKANAATDATKA
jgi:small subunit ribosomal protein S16